MAYFEPEKMAVYRLARQHTRAIHSLIKLARTRGFSDLVNQLRRSTTSIPANILEAYGEWHPGKRMNYLLIAKGSTWESWGHCDSFVDFQLVDPERVVEVHNLQKIKIAALLVTTIRNLEDQGIVPEE